MASAPFCSWTNCTDKDTVFVHGRLFCSQHEVEELRRLVLEGLPALSLDEKGRPLHRLWLNCFARLLALFATGALTKGKIEQRATNFSFHGPVVHFRIERHPVGRVMEQRWSFCILTGQLELISESILDSDYEQDEDNHFLCPTCKNCLEVTPGRAVCYECGYENRHEHSYSW